MLFITVCVFFISSRSFFDVSFILSNLSSTFWIFTSKFLYFFSGSLPISSSFIRSPGFYLDPSPAWYFSVFTFCLIFCVWCLLYSGYRDVVLASGLCPWWVRLVGGLCRLRGGGVCVWVLADGGDFPSVSGDVMWHVRATSGDVFWVLVGLVWLQAICLLTAEFVFLFCLMFGWGIQHWVLQAL